MEWRVDEILSYLLVGLARLKRGEYMSAMRFIQGYAVDRLLELAPLFEQEQQAFADPFTAERRFERRFPQMAQLLPGFGLGYERTAESAQNILEFLEEKIGVDAAIRRQILSLMDELPN